MHLPPRNIQRQVLQAVRQLGLCGCELEEISQNLHREWQKNPEYRQRNGNNFDVHLTQKITEEIQTRCMQRDNIVKKKHISTSSSC